MHSDICILSIDCEGFLHLRVCNTGSFKEDESSHFDSIQFVYLLIG